MKFRYLFLLGALGLLIGAALAQSTVVNVTVVDLGGQVWKNGTVSYVFQPNPSYSGVYQWNGAALPSQYLTPQIVALNSSGAGSWTIPTSTAISPAGSSWRYTVCPNATSPCSVINISASGSTQNISSTITANTPAITTQAGLMPLAYSDFEILTVPNQGGTYFNTSTFQPKYYDGASWQFYGGAPGTFVQLNPSGNQVVNQPVVSGVQTTLGINAAALGSSSSIAGIATQALQPQSYANLQSLVGDLSGYCYTNLCSITVVGTSLEICWGAGGTFNCSALVGPSIATNRQIEQIRIALQDKYGNHGTGLVPIISDVNSNTINNDFWSISGSYTTDSTLGPYETNGVATAGVVKLAAGAIATFTTGTQDGAVFNADNLNVYCENQPGAGVMTVTIDGVVQGVTACGSATTLAHILSYPSLTASTHTATFTCSANCFIYGAQWTLGTTGFEVNNLAVGGSISEWYGGHPTTQFAFMDLIPTTVVGVIDAYGGTNDGTFSYSPTNMAANINAVISHEATLASKPSIILTAAPANASSFPTFTLDQYTKAQLSIVQTNNTGYVNMQYYWGTTYNNNFSYYNTGTFAGIHYSDKGALAVFSFYNTEIFSGTSLTIPTVVRGQLLQLGTTTYPIKFNGDIRGSGCPSCGQIHLSNDKTIAGLQMYTIGAGNANYAAGVYYNGTGVTMTNALGNIITLGSTPGQIDFFKAVGSVGGNGTLTGLMSLLPDGHINGNIGGTFSLNLDVGLSRLSAGKFAIGNGTQGDASGSLNLANVTDSALTSGNCVQAGTAGLLGTIALPCTIVYTGTGTLTTATSDSFTIAGITASSNCGFSPTNSIAANPSTVLAYVSAVTTNSITITHAATVGAGATFNIMCK